MWFWKFSWFAVLRGIKCSFSVFMSIRFGFSVLGLPIIGPLLGLAYLEGILQYCLSVNVSKLPREYQCYTCEVKNTSIIFKMLSWHVLITFHLMTIDTFERDLEFFLEGPVFARIFTFITLVVIFGLVFACWYWNKGVDNQPHC